MNTMYITKPTFKEQVTQAGGEMAPSVELAARDEE